MVTQKKQSLLSEKRRKENKGKEKNKDTTKGVAPKCSECHGRSARGCTSIYKYEIPKEQGYPMDSVRMNSVLFFNENRPVLSKYISP